MELDEIGALFKAHLERKRIDLRCPICRTNHFSVQSPVFAASFASGDVELSRGIPMLPVVCQNCFHVLKFAWLPIRGGS